MAHGDVEDPAPEVVAAHRGRRARDGAEGGVEDPRVGVPEPPLGVGDGEPVGAGDVAGHAAGHFPETIAQLIGARSRVHPEDKVLADAGAGISAARVRGIRGGEGGNFGAGRRPGRLRVIGDDHDDA